MRVLTYNLRALADDPEAAAQVVASVEPDVALLQEIPRGVRSAYRMRAFAHGCGMRWPGRTRRVSGTSLMLGPRAQLLSREDCASPVDFAENPRTYSKAIVRIANSCTVVVASIHLPLRAEQRRQHVGQILSEMTVHRDYEGLPWVTGGDLNEEVDAPAWRQLGQHVPLVTSPSRPTFPSAAPTRTIDAIFATGSAGFAPVNPAQFVSERVLTAATDHRPVCVDLTFASDAGTGAVVAGPVPRGAQNQQDETNDGAHHAKDTPGHRADGRKQGAEKNEQGADGQADDDPPEVQIPCR